jgi:hypothetical protein
MVLYFVRKRLNAMTIHHELRATLGPEAVNYPSITVYLREVKFLFPISPVTFSESDLQTDDSDIAILFVLND